MGNVFKLFLMSLLVLPVLLLVSCTAQGDTAQPAVSGDGSLASETDLSETTAQETETDPPSEESEPLPGEVSAPRDAPKIYRFGGDGNDWCFVYLPPEYDPDRAEPYPFVICNHGNGWKMDGTAKYANWTKRTMYVPLDDPDYVRDPANYNGTDDASLWYSNPTIEALLGAGYIVAGCQNYADNLYGNDQCRDACVDFYTHMVDTYNVEDSCYMIGASNGAMTTLNASYLLGERVKAVILQYPLCCLTNQYFGHADHQKPIRTAYGITDTDLTEEEFLARIGAEFDPLYANVTDGVKQGYFPATKIYFSTTDTTTKATLNAMPLYKLLSESGKTVEIVRVDAVGQKRQHGDYVHFDPAGYLTFFETHK